MKKPLIGVTPSLDQETKDSTCRPTYLAAIRHAGGIPVILPLKAESEDFKQLVIINGAAALISIARGKIESITSNIFDSGKVVIPFVHVIDYYKGLSE